MTNVGAPTARAGQRLREKALTLIVDRRLGVTLSIDEARDLLATYGTVQGALEGKYSRIAVSQRALSSADETPESNEQASYDNYGVRATSQAQRGKLAGEARAQGALGVLPPVEGRREHEGSTQSMPIRSVVRLMSWGIVLIALEVLEFDGRISPWQSSPIALVVILTVTGLTARRRVRKPPVGK